MNRSVIQPIAQSGAYSSWFQLIVNLDRLQRSMTEETSFRISACSKLLSMAWITRTGMVCNTTIDALGRPQTRRVQSHADAPERKAEQSIGQCSPFTVHRSTLFFGPRPHRPLQSPVLSSLYGPAFLEGTQRSIVYSL